MIVPADDDPRGFIERIFSNPSAMATLLVAVVGQGMISIVLQIVNNEQQEAKIAANATALTDFKTAIFQMQTPLSQRVFKVEDRIEEVRRAHEDQAKRIDQIDTAGTRALALVTANQQRVMAQIDRLGDRLLMQDKAIADFKGHDPSPVFQAKLEEMNRNSARLEDQQRRIIEALDNLYSQVSKIPPALRANPKKEQ